MASAARAERRRKAREQATIKAPLPAYIDLVHYVKSRTRCTTGVAVRVLFAGALKVDSHPIGFKFERNGRKNLDRYVPAEFRDRITIATPDPKAFD